MDGEASHLVRANGIETSDAPQTGGPAATDQHGAMAPSVPLSNPAGRVARPKRTRVLVGVVIALALVAGAAVFAATRASSNRSSAPTAVRSGAAIAAEKLGCTAVNFDFSNLSWSTIGDDPTAVSDGESLDVNGVDKALRAGARDVKAASDGVGREVALKSIWYRCRAMGLAKPGAG